jgi:hypothetical protein
MNNNITLIITGIILILFLKSFGKRNYKNEIVSLGVFGTFVGIAIGLYHFDVTNLKGSMPLLLEGLKTAFITSGIGIFFSIVLSIFKPIKSEKEKKEEKERERNDTLKALEMIVAEFNNNLTKQFGDNFKQLNESVKAMIIWQENYKTHLTNSEESLNKVLVQLQKIEVLKQNEQKAIQALIDNLLASSKDVQKSLESTTDIVKEQMQLLLREANRRL